MADPTLSAALDRLNEARWFISEMAQWFHWANQFRWSLNSFLRALKEVPQIISMELQGVDSFSAWFKEQREAAKGDGLLPKLSRARDYVVHQGMLIPASTCFVGFTNGNVLKLGMQISVNPRFDSDDAILIAAKPILEQGDPLGFFADEDSGTWPCVQREWHLKDLPSQGILELSQDAWARTAKLAVDSLGFIGQEQPDLSRVPFPATKDVWLRIYDASKLRAAATGQAATGDAVVDDDPVGE